MSFFSIFGKKEKPARRRDPDTASRSPVTAATSAQSQREIARRTAAKIDEIESQMDLAIPARVSRPETAPPAELPPPAVNRELPPLEMDGNMVVFPPAQPRPAPAAEPVAASPARSGGPALSLVPTGEENTSLILGAPGHGHGVEFLSTGLLPAFEEASVLFANGQSNEAAMILWQSIKENQLGSQVDQAWKMLFELYQAAGRRSEFESLAIDYASRFESSPPTWVDELAPPAASAPPPQSSSTIQFPPRLDAQAIKQVEQIQRANQRNRTAEVDFSRIVGVDAIGADLLLRVLTDFRKHGKPMSIAGIGALRNALGSAVQPGRRDASDACWLLLLEVLRVLGEQPVFEDLAIEYCVTYEVSPPSWEGLPKSVRLQEVAAASAASAAKPATSPVAAAGNDEAFALDGEIDGRPESLFKALHAWAEPRTDVVLDCRRLRRMDFVAAGELLNEVAALTGAGKTLVIRDLSYLVACLFTVMGIHEMAELTVRTR